MRNRIASLSASGRPRSKAELPRPPERVLARKDLNSSLAALPTRWNPLESEEFEFTRSLIRLR
jgi:hypothetical protein